MTVLDSSDCFGAGKKFPPGFRFHPTDEELVLYYLKRKICRRRLKQAVIGDTDVYKWDPEDLPGLSKLKTGDRQWFFFSPRDRKHPNGARSNRATKHGHWKVTGKDRIITHNSRSVGVKKTLVFYKGRAPSGERTDWVMHEYTLNEEELKRCPSAQDYYALYKLYKKSGPGPQNGKRYGAPFREEDWADDEDIYGHIDQENTLKEVNDVAPTADTQINGEEQTPFDDLDQFVNWISDDPVCVPPPAVSTHHLQLHLVDEEHSTLFDHSSKEVNIPDQSVVFLPCCQQDNVHAGFDMTQSVTSQSQLYEASDVTSAPSLNAKDPCVVEEDFIEDFLEMDDLLGREPAIQYSGKPFENLQCDEIDGLCEFDLYYDAVMFLRDMGPCEAGNMCQPYMNNPENGVVNAISNSYLRTLENGTASYELQPQSVNADQINCQLWAHDQKPNIFAPTETNEGTIYLPSPGVECGDTSLNLPTGVNQNYSSREDDGSESWLSSALWAFVESIPTRPASASESALVSRALEGVSSFSKVRINSKNTTGSRPNPTRATTTSRYGRSKSGFICFSVVGLMFAILWMLVR